MGKQGKGEEEGDREIEEEWERDRRGMSDRKMTGVIGEVGE